MFVFGSVANFHLSIVCQVFAANGRHRLDCIVMGSLGLGHCHCLNVHFVALMPLYRHSMCLEVPMQAAARKHLPALRLLTVDSS